MNLELKRKTFTAKSTIGELYINGERACFTLEPPVKTDGTKPRAIPEGSYPVVMRVSPRFSPQFGSRIPHVEDVPDFQNVLIHVGNVPEDTEGCILVGHDLGAEPDTILHSRTEYTSVILPKLRAAQDAGEELTLSVSTEAAETEAEGEAEEQAPRAAKPTRVSFMRQTPPPEASEA